MTESSDATAALAANVWERKFGYKAVELYPTGPDRRHILLNGPRGGICLDTTSAKLPDDARSIAWSSDSLHYLHVAEDYVTIARPGRIEPERVPAKAVVENFPVFEDRLEDDDPYLIESVANRAARVFGSLRSYYLEEEGSLQSVHAFLALLAAKSCDAPRTSLKEATPWLAPEAVEAAASMAQPVWDDLSRILSEKTAGLTIDAALLLRHASGKVFQEAHYLSISPPQQSLGIVSPAPARRGIRTPRQGIFFTPSSLARSTVEQALRVSEDGNRTATGRVCVFDPACGSGEFLKEFIRQFRGRASGMSLHLVGWDASPVAVAMAHFMLSYEKQSVRDIDVTFEVECRNSLTSDWPRDVNFILMNPPFVSTVDLSKSQRSLLAERYSEVAHGRADLAFAFVYEALKSLGAGAVLASLVPASVLESSSAKRLRAEIEHRGLPRVIAHFGSQGIFTDAQVDTGLIIVDLSSAEVPTTYAWSSHEPQATSKLLRALRTNEMHGIAYPSYNVYERPFKFGGWTPRSLQNEQHYNEYRDTAPKVQDMFRVDQGVLTARNKTFILSAQEVSELPASERRYFRDAVMNRSIVDGRLRHGYKVFFPHFDHTIEDEEQLQAAVPTYYNFRLRPDLKALKARKDRKGKPLPAWWELSRNVKELGEPKIISTYFGAPGKFAYDADGTWVPVQAYMYRIKATRDGVDSRIWYAALAILNSRFFENLVASVAQRMGGGQFNLSVRYVDKLPFPDLQDHRIRDAVDALAIAGENISRGDSMQLLKLEDAVTRAYAPWAAVRPS